MQTALLIAGILSLITGMVHSILGEVLIFRHLRAGGLVPTLGAPPLQGRHIRIIWATWHLATVFGWAFGAILLKLAIAPTGGLTSTFILTSVVIAYALCGLLVLIGTKGRHPGWVALLVTATLALAALSVV